MDPKALSKNTRKELEDLKFALDASSIVTITDKNGTITYANEKFCEISRYTESELLQKNHYIINSGYHSKEFFEEMWNTINQGEIWKGEIRNRSKNGDFFWVDTVIVPFVDKAGKPYQYVSIQKDITEQKAQQERIYQLAFYDSTTSLPNRKFFEKELEKKIKENKKDRSSFSVILIDIDRFKYLNDTLGHKRGDNILQQIARRIEKFRQPNDVLTRMNGDEFTFILADVNNEEQLKARADEILNAFQQPFNVNHYEVRVTVSMGGCIYPNNGNTAASLLKNAHIALHRAKQTGKNCFRLFHSYMDVYAYKIFMLENDLYRAVDNEEFLLHYQPRIDIKTGKIVAAEALIRWKHKNWDMISPNEFIPLAEEIGLIVPMTNWILKTVCKQNKAWQNAGFPKIPISVNLSAKHFMQKNITQTIKDVLDGTGLEPKYLEIEITESIMIENDETVITVLNELKEIGVRIALDDFGTGYCSLNYLKKFNMDTVKIDKVFIRNIPINQADTAIVASIIHLVHVLEKRIVAEGVENEEQLRFLYEKHCDEIQGYLYSKPLPLESFVEVLKEGKCLLNDNEDAIHYDNQRKYFRIDLDYPLISNIVIKEFCGKEVDLESTEVLIDDIGPGGVRFSSIVKLPANPDILYKIETQILGEQLQLLGQIVWSREIDTNVYEHGLQFLLREDQRSWLIKSLNNFAEKIEANPDLLDTSNFVRQGKWSYFKQKLQEKKIDKDIKYIDHNDHL